MKQNKLYSWLTSLLVMVMLALVGQTALAQDASFDFVANKYVGELTSGDVQVNYKNYEQGANIWGPHDDVYKIVFTGLNGAKITKIEFEVYQQGYNYGELVASIGSLSYNYSGTSVWTGEAESVLIDGTDYDTDVYITTARVWVSSSVSEPITYTVVVNDAPVGATVTLDDQNMTAGGQITVEKNLSLSNLSVTEPTGYYAEKEYDATTHTFTVTFKEYLQYPVVVTGTTDANAGVVYDGVTYHAGESVLTKTALTAADVTAAEVSDLEGTVTLDAGTFTVTYKAPEYIEFITTGLSGYGYGSYNETKSGVNIYAAVFSGYLNIWNSSWTATISSSTFKIAKVEFECIQDLNISSNVGSMDNSASYKKVWTGSAQSVIFSTVGDLQIAKVRVYLDNPTPETYTVSISGNPSEAKLKYDGNEYANGSTFTATLSESDLSATEIAGYNYEITIDGTTINVVYSEKPSMKIDYVTVNGNTIENGGQVESMDDVRVYMNEAFDYIGSVPDGVTFIDNDDKEQSIKMCYSMDDTSLLFVFSNTIITPGTYTLHIPAGAIKNTTTGLENKEINFQFVIPTPVEFAAPTLTPTEGAVESLKEFTLTAPAGVTFNTERSLSTITVNGNTEYIYDYEYAEDGSSLTFSLNGEYTTDGQAVVVLPQGFVRSTTNEYCPEITATYTVAYPWYEIHSYSALEPDDGSEVKELSTITISAPDGITFDCTSAGEERNITISLNGKDEVVSANVYADRIVLNYATKAVGSYEFVIAANAIPANSGKKGNKAVSFSYSIAPTLSVSNVGWTTFCYDKPFTLADGYTPYMIQTAEDGVAEPVEILGAPVPAAEPIKGYIIYQPDDYDISATMSNGFITGPSLDGKVEVTYGGTFSDTGSYYEVYDDAWVEVKGMDGNIVATVVPRSWDPYIYDSYNYDATAIEGGVRINWTSFSYFGGLDIYMAIPGEYEKPIIPASTGILVQGTPAQDVDYQVAYGATSDVTGNILTGCVADKTVTDTNKLFYKFSLNASRDAGSEGFYWDSNDGHSINMHGGKAYLILDADDAASIRGFRLFGGETEGITGVATESENAPAFNLQGQRVNKNNFRSGLYIQNGKKVLVK